MSTSSARQPAGIRAGCGRYPLGRGRAGHQQELPLRQPGDREVGLVGAAIVEQAGVHGAAGRDGNVVGAQPLAGRPRRPAR